MRLMDENKPLSASCADCVVTTMAYLFLTLSVIISLFAVSFGMPLHASCKVTWSFESKCSDVKTSIVNQMTKWQTNDNCKNGGEKCLYKVTSQSDNEVKGTHETPKAHYVDDLTITFVQDGASCKVNGKSSSETWYALLDKGTNYCNLHNLITGAGLDKLSGYKESTSNSICTQYSSADCDKY